MAKDKHILHYISLKLKKKGSLMSYIKDVPQSLAASVSKAVVEAQSTIISPAFSRRERHGGLTYTLRSCRYRRL